MGHESDNQPPPAYADAAPGAEEQKPPSLDLSPLFSQLRLTSEPGRPNPDSCLAHLKFLFAIETLKEEVGYSDGLWGLWDSRVADHAGSENHKTEKDKISNGVADSSASHEEALSRIREKRWALFVARAVDRYEAWWRLQGDGPPLTEMDRDEEHSHSFSDFPKAGIAKFWAEDTLPPLGKFVSSKMSDEGAVLTLQRRPHGTAHTHLEPTHIPRRLHARGASPSVVSRHALGSHQPED